MWKFLDQGSNVYHSSDKARFLTPWATRELLRLSLFKIKYIYIYEGKRLYYFQVMFFCKF